MTEQTFMMVKPDGVKRKLVGEIIKRVEQKGFTIVKLKMMNISDELAARHYGEHKGKPFYQELIDFITSGPVVAMVVQGETVVEGIHNIAGATNPIKALYGTIRGDFASDFTKNVVHTSDSIESAKREIKNFFGE